MTLRLIPDDEDDSLAANPEDARGDLGYDATTAPRSARRPTGKDTRWTFVEVAGKPRDGESGPIGGALECAPAPKGCGQPTPVLHADPRTQHPQRVICGKCQGERNAERMGGRR